MVTNFDSHAMRNNSSENKLTDSCGLTSKHESNETLSLMVSARDINQQTELHGLHTERDCRAMHVAMNAQMVLLPLSVHGTKKQRLRMQE
eukprot:scaffold290101_cov18-Prasinocladus_malaysianus.AAC.1